VLALDWTGGVYGLSLADGGIGPVQLADGGMADERGGEVDPALLAPVPCGYGGTLTGPVQLFSEGVWTGVGRAVRGQYEWCAGGFSGDDLSGIYGSGDSADGFTAFLAGGARGGLGIYRGRVRAGEIVGVVSGLGLDGYRWRITEVGQ
jgi:hypothetical protein